MYKDVFIGVAHDEKFDFNVEGNANGYVPTILFGRDKDVPMGCIMGKNDMFWDLVDNPLCKKMDWASWGLMRTAKDMVLLLNERYPDNCYAQYLIRMIRDTFIVKGLGDVELVLDAVES